MANYTGYFNTESSTVATVNETDIAINISSFDYFAEQLASGLTVFYMPLLVFLGVLGNLLSIIVFYRSNLRLQSTSQYLTALAVSDTVFLVQLIPPWLNAAQLTNIFHHNGVCQTLVYTSYVCCTSSSWLVVAFTIERFVAVTYPLRRNVLCTVTRARYVIYILALGAFLVNAPVLLFAKPRKGDCNINEDYMESAARFNFMDTAISFTVPLAVIVLLNSGIMFGVYRLEKERKRLMKLELETGHRRPLSAATSQYPRSQNRVTRMLLIVSTVFVLLNFPAYTMRILAYGYESSIFLAKTSSKMEYSDRWAALQQVAIMFFNTNFGINFILYCMIGQNFRRALLQTLPFVRNKARLRIAVRRATPYRHRASCQSTTLTEGTNVCNIPMPAPRDRDDRSLSDSDDLNPDEPIEMEVFTTTVEVRNS